MTKEEFKTKWDNDDITYDDIAKCAVEWGLYNRPRTCDINKVTDAVLLAAGIDD